uniref:Uncharacterized protein n=1 Tax=Myoviridae sp. ctCo31 TaxID=2825053 RepID=A0A8S5UMV2_9CAUD|nr:MAG TPA: hypothetical protein [Myoviridae sp. ctCo31]
MFSRNRIDKCHVANLSQVTMWIFVLFMIKVFSVLNTIVNSGTYHVFFPSIRVTSEFIIMSKSICNRQNTFTNIFWHSCLWICL